MSVLPVAAKASFSALLIFSAGVSGCRSHRFPRIRLTTDHVHRCSVWRHVRQPFTFGSDADDAANRAARHPRGRHRLKRRGTWGCSSRYWLRSHCFRDWFRRPLAFSTAQVAEPQEEETEAPGIALGAKHWKQLVEAHRPRASSFHVMVIVHSRHGESSWRIPRVQMS
jgi:hypothetical protein